ncbi:MAG: NHLP bacteriocin system secretion protein [Candidatus Ozemobacteraceae bacterium]
MNPFASKPSDTFRQAALDRLSSPERIDKLDVIIPRRSWLILLGFFIFMSLGLFWGLQGSIPTTVEGKGILLARGGVLSVFAPGSGRLTGIAVKPEQFVKKGEVLAMIDHPELRKEIEEARERLSEVSERHRLTQTLRQNEQTSQTDLLQKRRANLLDSLDVLKSQKKFVMERMGQQEQLQQKELLTRQAVILSLQEVQRLDEQMRDTEHQLKKLPAEALDLTNRHAREVLQGDAEIAEASRSVDLLEKRNETTSGIIAPDNGRVLEIMAVEGDLVNLSQTIFSLEPQGSDKSLLEAIIYVPLKDGKQVKPGMTIQITPASVKREEFGFILGTVKSVSPFPATAQGMQSVLGNNQLVQALLAGGAAIAIRAELRHDPTSPCGYQWSSGKGPVLTLTSGTLCNTAIVVREQPPITLVIPTLKEYTGL